MRMRRSQILMIVGVLVALSLGLALAYPLLANQMPTLEKPELGLTVVYTYISSPLNDSSLTGVWRNYSSGWQTENLIFSYIIVMNITNYSDMSVQATSLQVMVGPDIKVGDSGGLSSRNAIIEDYRMKEFSLIFEDIWAPQESKLVCMSGYTGLPSSFYNVVNDGTLWVFGKIEARKAYSSGSYSSAYDLRLVQLQNLNGNYLYNSLLNDDQMLRLYGLNAYVVPRNLD